MEPIGA